MLTKDAHFPGQFDVAKLRGMRTVREYDDRYIAPLYGFQDSEDYYERASCRHVLPSISVPALILHASDDPFIPLTDRVRTVAAANPLIRMVETANGGHVGWVGATRRRDMVAEDRHWVENRVVDFLHLLAKARCPNPTTNPTAVLVP
jgi:predicted alpha/beta-fold hydrolase